MQRAPKLGKTNDNEVRTAQKEHKEVDEGLGVRCGLFCSGQHSELVDGKVLRPHFPRAMKRVGEGGTVRQAFLMDFSFWCF